MEVPRIGSDSTRRVTFETAGVGGSVRDRVKSARSRPSRALSIFRNPMARNFKSLLHIILTVAMAYGLVLLSYAGATAMPGTISRAGWEAFASIVFVGNIIPAVILMRRSQLGSLGQALAGILVIAILTLSAFAVQIQDRCGPPPVYIAELDVAWNDSECGD